MYFKISFGTKTKDSLFQILTTIIPSSTKALYLFLIHSFIRSFLFVVGISAMKAEGFYVCFCGPCDLYAVKHVSCLIDVSRYRSFNRFFMTRTSW